VIGAPILAVAVSRCANAKRAVRLDKASLRVNVNTASMEELQTIPNIGPSRAKSITDHRPYNSSEDLVTRGAIGKTMLEKVRPFIKTDGKNEKLKRPPF
jgi:competence ComEA-like helix-hairpin-helix protein